MNILYIGQVVPNDKIDNCSAYSIPGDIFQKELLLGLHKHEDINIYAVSCYPNSSWPHNKVRIKGAMDKIGDNINVNNVNYINVPLLKQCSQEYKMIENAYRIAKVNSIDIIMVYNMYPQFGGAALKLERWLKRPLVAILADFPNDDNNIWGGTDGFFTKIMNVITWHNIKKLKYAIVLNRNAQNFMKNGEKILVMPGGVDKPINKVFSYKNVNNRDIVYAGALVDYSGVLDLIEAVNIASIDNICLKIYGDGPLKEEILKKVNGKVKYMGKVSINEMREILEKSWILVNPRRTNDFVSSVTFPSKIFEYIMCCRPVISTEFSGMPDEIRKLVWGCGSGRPKEIVNCINMINSMSDENLEKMVRNAFDSVVNEFSWDANCKKVKYFCRQILNEL